MHINGFALYKIIEFDKGVLLANYLDKMNDRQHVELIVGDARTCAYYLARYLHARGNGAAGISMPEAHRQALEGLTVVKKWEQA